MLVNTMLAANHRAPQAPAVSDGVRTLTYKQLTLLASVFKDVVSKETRCERVGIMLPASTAFPPALMGVLWSSRIAIPLNFLLNAEELARIVSDAELDLILTVRHFKDLAENLPARALYLEDLLLRRRMFLAMFRSLPEAAHVDREATAVILYTSGTTAEPKGVELTFGNLHSNCVDTICTLNIDSKQRFLNILPPFHVFGLTGNVLIPMALGAFVHAIPRFNPAAAVRAIDQQQISIILAVPSMYAAMLRVKSATRDSFRSVYLAVSGGEPLSDRVRREFEERFGVTLRQGYGLTETSPIISTCTATTFRDGTVGKPIRGVDVGIVGPERQTLAQGGEGEIVVRGPGVMKGYFRRPEETRKVIDENGWLHTGDVGRLDEDGFLHITGRAKEMLIIGGENVFPREIEAALEAHEAVVQAAVIGMQDDLRGEVPFAFVIPKPEAKINEHQLRNFAKQSLAGFKVPRRIEIREDLPTSPTGKILKRRLSEFVDHDSQGA